MRRRSEKRSGEGVKPFDEIAAEARARPGAQERIGKLRAEMEAGLEDGPVATGTDRRSWRLPFLRRAPRFVCRIVGHRIIGGGAHGSVWCLCGDNVWRHRG